MDYMDLYNDKTYLNNIDEVIFKDSVQSAISPSNLERPVVPDILSTTDELNPLPNISDTQTHISQQIKAVEDIPKPLVDIQDDPLNIPQKEPELTAEDVQVIEELSVNKDKVQSQAKPFKVIQNDEVQNTKVDFIFPKKSASVDFLDDFSAKGDASSQGENQLIEDIEQIPDRLAFKIGEVAFLTGVKSYILRYWESEFEALKPKKANNNRRIYTQKDVKTILLIKKLLYKDKYSIEGAKKALKFLQSKLRNQHNISLPSSSHRQQQAIKQIKELMLMISDMKNHLKYVF